MPLNPFIVSGTAYNSFGNRVHANVTFTSANGSKTVFTNNAGQYIMDLADIDYSSSETISCIAEDDFSNEIYSGSFVVSGANLTWNISLSDRKAGLALPTNRGTLIYTVGAKPITNKNPMPVQVSKIPLNDGEFTLTYDGSNNLTKVVKVISGVTYTRNLSYDSSNNLTNISRWVSS